MKRLHILPLVLCISRLDARMLLLPQPDPVWNSRGLDPRADIGKFYFVDYFRILKKDGSDYPCSGHVNDPSYPIVHLRAGREYELPLYVDVPRYDGGSCQLALSYDQGETFTVIKSIIGDCMITPSYRFTVPVDAPTGKAVVAMTHFNRRQAQDMFMSCAPAIIAKGDTPLGAGNGSQSQSKPQQETPFDSRPHLFIANVDQLSPCKTFEGVDLVFPNPGPNVEYGSEDLKFTGKSGYTCSSSPSSSLANTTASAPASCPPLCTFTVTLTVSFDQEPTPTTSFVTSKLITSVFQTSLKGISTPTSGPLSQSSVASETRPVPSSATDERCPPGALRCDSNTTFSLCSEEREYFSMGSLRLPANAECVDGEIIFDL